MNPEADDVLKMVWVFTDEGRKNEVRALAARIDATIENERREVYRLRSVMLRHHEECCYCCAITDLLSEAGTR